MRMMLAGLVCNMRACPTVARDAGGTGLQNDGLRRMKTFAAGPHDADQPGLWKRKTARQYSYDPNRRHGAQHEALHPCGSLWERQSNAESPEIIFVAWTLEIPRLELHFLGRPCTSRLAADVASFRKLCQRA